MEAILPEKAMTMIELLDTDQLFSKRPELFVYPVRPMEIRLTVFVGELVKVLTGIREEQQLVSGCWLVVESIESAESGLRITGRSWQPYNPDDFCITFGPENIYRMEPRRFFLWGSAEIPIAMRSACELNANEPAQPLDSQGQPIEECKQVLLEFSALGRKAAEDHYRELAVLDSKWPSLEELR